MTDFALVRMMWLPPVGRCSQSVTPGPERET